MAWGSAANRSTARLMTAVCLLLIAVGGAWAGDTSTLFVYLEIPASYAVPTQLSLAELTIRANGLVTSLTPHRRHLDTAELAGRQILLARAEVASAYYDSLTLVLGAVALQSGVAEVRPPVALQGEVIAIGADLLVADAVVVSLIWHPGPAPESGQVYHPHIRTVGRAVPPLGALSFVTEQAAGCVLVVDRLAGRVVAAAQVGKSPGGMAYSARRQKLYVAEADGDGIAVVDALTLRCERIVPLSFGDDPERLALSEDETSLYVLNPGSRSLAVVATRSMQVKYRVSVGDGPRSLAVDPLNGNIYVACEYESEVQVFGPNGLVQQASLQAVTSPVEVIFAANSRELFVTSRTQNRLQGFDLSGGKDLGAQSLCGPAGFLAYSPRSRQLFAGIPGCGEVAVLQPADGIEFAPLVVAGSPGYLAFDPTFRQLLVLLPETASLMILEANRGTLQHQVELGGRPFAVLAP